MTTDEFTARYSERETRLLTDVANTGSIDALRLQVALDEATGLMDGYLARRYALPLTHAQTLQPVVPELLKRICGDVARYVLTGTQIVETEVIRKRYDDAMRMLDRMANGDVALGVDLVLASSSAAPTGGATAVRSGARVFDDDTLGGML